MTNGTASIDVDATIVANYVSSCGFSRVQPNRPGWAALRKDGCFIFLQDQVPGIVVWEARTNVPLEEPGAEDPIGVTDAVPEQILLMARIEGTYHEAEAAENAQIEAEFVEQGDDAFTPITGILQNVCLTLIERSIAACNG